MVALGGVFLMSEVPLYFRFGGHFTWCRVQESEFRGEGLGLIVHGVW